MKSNKTWKNRWNSRIQTDLPFTFKFLLPCCVVSMLLIKSSHICIHSTLPEPFSSNSDVFMEFLASSRNWFIWSVCLLSSSMLQRASANARAISLSLLLVPSNIAEALLFTSLGSAMDMCFFSEESYNILLFLYLVCEMMIENWDHQSISRMRCEQSLF